MKLIYFFLLFFLDLCSFENKLFAQEQAQAQEQVQVAFLEMHDISGRRIVLEPHGQFAHVAISFHNLWLHSYPGHPVELISTTQLLKLGTYVEFVTVSIPPLEYNDISKFIGQEYDFDFEWTNDKMYCSELVSKILRVSPRPMNFNAPYWPKSYRKKNGRPGMSPDHLYQILSGWREMANGKQQ
jgi:hypothetical protein